MRNIIIKKLINLAYALMKGQMKVDFYRAIQPWAFEHGLQNDVY